MTDKIESKCSHCGNEDIKVTSHEAIDDRGYTWIVTEYSCKKCKFFGTQNERIPKPKPKPKT